MRWTVNLRALAAVLLITISGITVAQNPDQQDQSELSTNGQTQDIGAPNEPEPERLVFTLDLDEDLTAEQRSAVLTVLDELPTIAAFNSSNDPTIPRPTHRIAQHPFFGEHIVLHEIQGAGPVHHRALDRGLEAGGAMPIEAVFDFYGNEFRRKNAWASNIAVPIEIGAVDRSTFAAELRGEILRIARRAALIDLVRWQRADDVSVCLSNSEPSLASCPLPEGGDRWNVVDTEKPIYLAVDTRAPEKRYVSIVGLNREGQLRHVMTGETETFYQTIPAGSVRTSNQEPQKPDRRGVFTSLAPLNEVLTRGHHELLVITSRHPIDPAIWDQDLTGTVPSGLCANDTYRGICEALQAKQGHFGFEWEGDAVYVPVGVRSYIPRTPRLVRAHLATSAVSKWQAQLLRYQKEETAGASGRRRFDFKESHKCGGVYLGGNYVLTAAHCIPRGGTTKQLFDELRIRVGTRDIRSGGKTFPVHSIAIHPWGNDRTRRVDLALIRLRATTAQLNALGSSLESIDPAKNPRRNFAAIHGLTVTGWGFLKARLPGETGWLAADGSNQQLPNRLRQLVMEQAAMDECTAEPAFSGYKPKDILCLRSAVKDGDSCAGDSGGPVTARGNNGRELVGIVSRGVGCAYKDIPSVYVNVAEHRGWINRMKTLLQDSRPGIYRRK